MDGFHLKPMKYPAYTGAYMKYASPASFGMSLVAALLDSLWNFIDSGVSRYEALRHQLLFFRIEHRHLCKPFDPPGHIRQ